MRREETLVIGGGVIGVCSAYYLATAGRHVTIVEKGEICSGCSYGNAGLISPSHSIPLAAPGVLRKALKWMFDAESPFYVKPRLDLALISWLWSFGAACKESRAREAMPLLRDLGRASLELFQRLAAIQELDFGFRQNGLLILFRSRSGYRQGLEEAGLLRQVGIDSDVLSAIDVRDLDPTILPTVFGGVYFPQDAQLIPVDFVRGLTREAEKLGARICTSTEVLGWETSGRRITAVKTTRGDFRPHDVVLAGGAWSPLLSRDLGITLPVQAAKGYSITIKRPDNYPRTPLLFSEAKVFATPMGENLRFGGTLELAGLDLSVNRRRVDAVMRSLNHYISEIKNPEVVEIWRGLRPCSPDGLPIIGRSSRIENLIIATGHAMLGMSLGPITGKLVSQLLSNETPMIDVTALRSERFHRSLLAKLS
jgi:D-amino-acid dehydrogenase